MQGVIGASKGTAIDVLGSLSSFVGLCTGFCVTASRWQGSRVNALMNCGCEQTHGWVLAVLISLSAALLGRPGAKVLWQPYHQCADENAADEMGSVSNTNVCKCAYDRVASA